MNKVLLTGRITKDPEIRYSQTGMASVRFTLAVDRAVSRDANGNRQADFVSCVAFRQSADFISRYVKKGNMLAIEGSITTGQFQDQQGQTRYTTDVVIDRVENLSPRDPNQAPGQFQQPQQPQANPYQGYNNPTYGQARPQAPTYQQSTYQQPAPEAPKSFNVDVSDDDLPF